MAYNDYGGGGNDRYGGGAAGAGGGNGGGYGRSNPYEQVESYSQDQGNPYGSSQRQAQNPYSSQQDRYGGQTNSSSYGRQGQQPVEMQDIRQDAYGQRPQHGPGQTGTNGSVPPQQNRYGDGAQDGYGAPSQQQSGSPHAILNECRDIQRAIDDLEGRLASLQRAQRGFVSGNGATNREIDSMSADMMGTYRALADRVKRIKSKPEAGNPQNAPQVGNLDRRIKKAINAFQQQESAFRKEVQEQQKRQYLIVNPNATDAELREVSEAGGDTQIFQQALLNADRRGQAQSTLANVRQRHDAIQNIERTMMELAQLFQDLDTMVVQQDPIIQNVEKHAEDTQQHMVEANVQLEQATTKARSARKKKWICLGISVTILVVIAAAVLIYGATAGGWFRKNAPAQRKRATQSSSDVVSGLYGSVTAALGRRDPFDVPRHVHRR